MAGFFTFFRLSTSLVAVYEKNRINLSTWPSRHLHKGHNASVLHYHLGFSTIYVKNVLSPKVKGLYFSILNEYMVVINRYYFIDTSVLLNCNRNLISRGYEAKCIDTNVQCQGIYRTMFG